MNNLTKDLDTILIELIQLPRGKTVSHTDYRNRVLDTVIKALPKPKTGHDMMMQHGWIDKEDAAYEMALDDVYRVLSKAKESE